jgi:hypothetical protein
MLASPVLFGVDLKGGGFPRGGPGERREIDPRLPGIASK